MHFNVILFYFIYLAPVTCIKVYFNQQSISCWFIEKIFMNEYLTLKTNEKRRQAKTATIFVLTFPPIASRVLSSKDCMSLTGSMNILYKIVVNSI